MSFADKLKTIRKDKNITQEQLAEILNVSRQAVSKWESGNGYPETDKLLLIAKELDVSLDYLLLDKENNPAKVKNTDKPKSNICFGKIAISSFDKESVVICQAVKAEKILAPKKDEPKYILVGVDKVTFWGEHTAILGWYESDETIKQEISCIAKAIENGESSYTLKYASDIKLVGIFGQPKLKK